MENVTGHIRRVSSLLFGVMICIMATGCFKSKMVIKVKRDGTGTIIVSQIFSKDMVTMVTAQMKQMADQFAGQAGGMEMKMDKDPFYNEKKIKMNAGKFGPGVKFVKAARYDKEGAKGFVAIYSFDDINDIFINLSLSLTDMAMGPSMMNEEEDGSEDEEIEVADKENDAFEFKMQKNGDANTLRIIVPGYPEPDVSDADEGEEAEGEEAGVFAGPGADEGMKQMMAMGNPFGFTGKETASEAFQKTMRGFSESISIEIEGANQKSNAAFKQKTSKGGTRYILVDMDMSKILDSEEGRKKMGPDFMQMGMSSGSSQTGFYANINGLPGVQVQTNDFTISFK